MPAPKRKSLHQLQAQCDAWNAKNPEGTLVSYQEIAGEGETFRGKSISEAQVLSGHSAVIWLEGKRGCVNLSHCAPIQAQAQLSPAEADALFEKLLSAFDAVQSHDEAVPIILANAEDIRAIAGAYRETDLFTRNVEQYDSFKLVIEGDTPPENRLREAWSWLIERMANAPSSLHMVASVRLCVPMVADYLPSEGAV